MQCLFLSWPAYDCKYLIFIGEINGCTANDNFFVILNNEWITIKNIYLRS